MTVHPMALSQVPVGSRVTITCLPGHPELQRRLLAMGVRPGVEVEVLRRGRPGGILHLASGLLEFMLRDEQAADMQVTPLPPH
jgi:ferrous iron transport protein A